MRSQHLFTQKQEKPFKDTMKFKPKQCNTDIDRKEMKAANRLCRCEQEACTQAEQKLTVMEANKLL